MPLSSQPPTRRISVARLASSAHVVTPSGELDLYTVEPLRERLGALTPGDGSDVIVDLSRVDFVDSAALGVLVGAAGQLRQRGAELVVVTDDPRLRRLLEITGLLGTLHHERTLAAAVERVGRAA